MARCRCGEGSPGALRSYVTGLLLLYWAILFTERCPDGEYGMPGVPFWAGDGRSLALCMGEIDERNKTASRSYISPHNVEL
jgi:hypothetical protein